MAVTREEKEARRLWEEHCKRVQSLTELSPEAEKETRAQRDARIRRLLANYPAFCEYYFPHYMRRTDPATGLVTGVVHNAPFHNAAFRDILRNRTFKAVFMWPRGHAKSTHLDIFIPVNLMVRGGGEIHCGPGTPGSEVWPGIRLTGTRQTSPAPAGAALPSTWC